ncbi:DUF6461 domain-containing protein [Streptomyces sp. NPDC088794]|uniref:DUF6461 domain-containing protein n=1 Tax=Streptomyces sp. NPDC088794 TaxID=3365902 RepID=UPI0037F71A18
MTSWTTTADYAWLTERYPYLMVAYCATLVRDLTPEELLARLGAEPEMRITGVAELGDPSYAAIGQDGQFVAVAAVGDWSLMIEHNGYLGVRPEVMRPISRGRTVVSHYCNVNAVDHFYWFDDEDIRLHFQPLFAQTRHGSRPDELLVEMRESGFDLSDDDDRDYSGHTEASFALAHRLTGIRLTPDLFDSARFLCGLVQLPRT